MQTVKDIPELGGKRVLLRAELNVPVEDGIITDDFRIMKARATLEYLQKEKARTIVVAHIADDAGGTLKPVFEYLAKHMPISFIERPREDGKDAIEAMEPGDIVLFENLRQDPGEEGNDKTFAEFLASCGDCYVQDAFPVAHRSHASVVGVPALLPTYAGLQFRDEFEHLSRALNPPHPFVFILGGIKFATKLPLVQKYLDVADTVFVGGAIANGFFEALGYNMDASITPDDDYGIEGMLHHDALLLPQDVGGPGFAGKKPEDVLPNESVFDAGPETINALQARIAEAAFVVWNGPISDYKQGFVAYNNALAHTIAESTAQSIVGGGDTIAAIRGLGLEDKFTFLSTAGGAMIQFLSEGILPGIEAIKKSQEALL